MFGDYRVSYVVDAFLGIISDEGLLRDDALLVFGKIGDCWVIVLLSEVQRIVEGVL